MLFSILFFPDRINYGKAESWSFFSLVAADFLSLKGCNAWIVHVFIWPKWKGWMNWKMSVQIRIIKTQLTGFRTKMNGIPVIWSNAQFLNKRNDSFEINFKIYIFPLIQFIIRFLDLLEIQSKNVHILTMSHFTFEIHSKQNRKTNQIKSRTKQTTITKNWNHTQKWWFFKSK